MSATDFWKKVKTSSSSLFSADKDPNEPCQKCANRHWLDVIVKPLPDKQKRPEYWPEEELRCYNNEPAIVTGIPKSTRKLNGSGQVYEGGLPAGTHEVTLYELLSNARKHAKEKAEEREG